MSFCIVFCLIWKIFKKNSKNFHFTFLKFGYKIDRVLITSKKFRVPIEKP